MRPMCGSRGAGSTSTARSTKRVRRLISTSPTVAKAAKRFLSAALKRSRDWIPRVINTDKNPAYGEAIAELKKEGQLPKDTQHRQVKYLNNRLEGGPFLPFVYS